MPESPVTPETQEISSSPKFQVETRGFKKYEVVEIKAENLFSAYEQIGGLFSKHTRKMLSEYQEEEEYQEGIAYATKSLEELKSLASTNTFTTSDGLNHLSRYLEVLEGFAKGSNITNEEAAFLQIENTAGCQTLVVRNRNSGEIVAVHTEEDADQYERTENASMGKRWLKLKLPDQEVEFCAYGELCGYGFASGIIQRGEQVMFQAADILGPKPVGPVWANAFAFMLMDCGSINSANELISKVDSFFPRDKPIFNGGYSIHQIEVGKPPETQSLEYGGRHIIRLTPGTSDNREIQFGVNYPRDSELQQIDDYDLSTDEYDKAEKEVMKRRQRRLKGIAGLVGRAQETTLWGEQQALKLIHKVIQKGRGDVLEGWFTGFSNDLVAQNVSVYVSPEGKMHLVIRKGYSRAKPKMKLSDQKNSATEE